MILSIPQGIFHNQILRILKIYSETDGLGKGRVLDALAYFDHPCGRN